MTRCAAAAAAYVLLLCAAAQAAGQPAPTGDAAGGERVFQYCFSCHSVDPKEAATLQGPNLAGVVGRPIAAQESFEYSPAMRAFAAARKTWSEDLLDRYITSPEKLVPKTTMAYPGLGDAQERADLIAFLKAKDAR